MVTAGTALARFPPNVQQELMHGQTRHLDWLPIKFLVASLFIKTQGPLMNPRQWTDLLRERRRIYFAARQSADFGDFNEASSGHIFNRDSATCEINPENYWPDTDFVAVSWTEADAGDSVVSDDQCEHPMTSTNPDNSLLIDTNLGSRPVAYFRNRSLWLSEPAVGCLDEVYICIPSRTVFVRCADGQALTMQFCS